MSWDGDRAGWGPRAASRGSSLLIPAFWGKAVACTRALAPCLSIGSDSAVQEPESLVAGGHPISSAETDTICDAVLLANISLHGEFMPFLRHFCKRQQLLRTLASFEHPATFFTLWLFLCLFSLLLDPLLSTQPGFSLPARHPRRCSTGRAMQRHGDARGPGGDGVSLSDGAHSVASASPGPSLPGLWGLGVPGSNLSSWSEMTPRNPRQAAWKIPASLIYSQNMFA